jgi:hypothetical protein
MTNQGIRHKALYVGITTAAAYFGFQALDLSLGIYQVETYFVLSWYVYAFHVFWLAFVFDLHLKIPGQLAHARARFKGLRAFAYAFAARVRHFYHWTYVRHCLNYLIVPSLIFWSVVTLMYLNPFHELFKDVLIIVSTFALCVNYWYLKQAFSRNMELHSTGLKVLALVKLFAAYLVFTAALAFGWYFGLEKNFLVPIVLLLTALLAYQALAQRRLLRLKSYAGIFMLAVLVSAVFAVVFQSWNSNYYTAGLLVAAVYNTGWGILHRYFERDLTRKLFWEYVFMLIVLVSLILATHDFQGRIG